jgi:hypothetical protein
MNDPINRARALGAGGTASDVAVGVGAADGFACAAQARRAEVVAGVEVGRAGIAELAP